MPKDLEGQIDRYLQAQPYSDWAGFSIRQEDRRKLAVEWMAKHMRAILDMPDPPKEKTVVEEQALYPEAGKAPVITVGGRGYTHKELEEMDQGEFAQILNAHRQEVVSDLAGVSPPTCSFCAAGHGCPHH